MFINARVMPVTAGLLRRRAFMVRVLLSVVQFRINARYVEGKPPFIAIELDHSDSGREGCAVSTLTVTSEPKDWRGATQVSCVACQWCGVLHVVRPLLLLTDRGSWLQPIQCRALPSPLETIQLGGISYESVTP